MKIGAQKKPENRRSPPSREDLLPAEVSGSAAVTIAALFAAATIFVASASGGLWKTTNRGITWRNVFDTMAVSTFGDIAIAPSNPRVVYAGTGEQNNRQSTSWGNGVYRSDDGGESWRHLGLEGTRHVGEILVQAIQAEGVPLTVWQRFILPAMTVFQAQNGYGKGCPWICPSAGARVDYAPEQYPVAQTHNDTHACIVMALRAPNGPDVARLLAAGIRKVMENVDQVG